LLLLFLFISFLTFITSEGERMKVEVETPPTSSPPPELVILRRFAKEIKETLEWQKRQDLWIKRQWLRAAFKRIMSEYFEFCNFTIELSEHHCHEECHDNCIKICDADIILRLYYYALKSGGYWFDYIIELGRADVIFIKDKDKNVLSTFYKFRE